MVEVALVSGEELEANAGQDVTFYAVDDAEGGWDTLERRIVWEKNIGAAHRHLRTRRVFLVEPFLFGPVRDEITQSMRKLLRSGVISDDLRRHLLRIGARVSQSATLSKSQEDWEIEDREITQRGKTYLRKKGQQFFWERHESDRTRLLVEIFFVMARQHLFFNREQADKDPMIGEGRHSGEVRLLKRDNKYMWKGDGKEAVYPDSGVLVYRDSEIIGGVTWEPGPRIVQPSSDDKLRDHVKSMWRASEEHGVFPGCFSEVRSLLNGQASAIVAKLAQCDELSGIYSHERIGQLVKDWLS